MRKSSYMDNYHDFIFRLYGEYSEFKGLTRNITF